MHSAYIFFKKTISEVRNLTAMHQYLTRTLQQNLMSFDDLLRSQIVYSLGALDKLVHDLVRSGAVEIFTGQRSSTGKFSNESMTIAAFSEWSSADEQMRPIIFERAFSQKIKTVSYQDPDKISDGLSYIWSESQKWRSISSELNMAENDVKTMLKLIVSRRNTIVHESDFDQSAGQKLTISIDDCCRITDFIERLGEAIYKKVKLMPLDN